MKVVTFSHKGKSPRLGLLEGESVVGVPWNGTLQGMITSGITPGRTSEVFPLSECRLLAPLYPGKIIGVGRNYAEHAAELGNEVPKEPLLFAKFSSSVIGDGETIKWRESLTTQVDWEGELAVVIGKRAYNITPEDAPKHIFGYTVANDISARDLQDKDGQWPRAKGMDTFCPLGPSVVLQSQIPDPQALTIVTKVNGETVQNGKTAEMIHNVYALVSHCSKAFTLEPGDLILTGTPSGVGKGMNPPRFLKDGDEVTVTIEEIGTLTNRCQIIKD